MCAAATARRRRSQMANGFKHLSPKERPNYKKRDAASSRARMLKSMETEKRIRAGGK